MLTLIRFSIYPPRTVFSDLSLRFSSLTSVTFLERSSRVLWSSRTRSMSRCFSSSSSELFPPFVVWLRCELFEIESPFNIITHTSIYFDSIFESYYGYHRFPSLVSRDLSYRSWLASYFSVDGGLVNYSIRFSETPLCVSFHAAT